MSGTDSSYLARATTDAEDCLLQAEEPLAELQLLCGGTIPGTVAIPELLSLVQKCRRYGFGLARSVRANSGNGEVKAWVEVSPNTDSGGCDIGIVSWRSSSLEDEKDAVDQDRRKEIDRHIAELTARLDAQQNVFAVDSQAADLEGLASAMQQGAGKPWTDFVELADSSHRQPMHWRLLDGMTCRVAGSDRNWTASLSPTGRGSDGFELLLVADTPLYVAEIAVPGLAAAAAKPVLGRDLGPVLRQPIARIIANAETIRTKLAGPLASEYSSYAADISSAGQHLLSLVEDLSDLEVVESEGFSTAPDQIDLGDCARRTVGILGVKAQDKRITLTAPEIDESLQAIGEFRRVLQVLLNLVGNAINYSPEGSEVTLGLSQGKGRASITVTDNGPGLSDEQRDVVFEKFERLGRSGDGGSGLGLYISRRLARAMDGDLTVESEPGQGARFTLSLPVQGPSS